MNKATTPEQAAAELFRRQRARESLVEYARFIEIPGAPLSDDPDEEVFRTVETSLATHHRVILEAIQRCIETPNGRLMIFAPPGSAKSSYASVVAPAWCLDKFDNYDIILTSYGDELPKRNSRRTRQIIKDPANIALWPGRPVLSDGNKAVETWSLTNGSTVRAAGILSGITGHRADGVVIDDPVKGRDAADSERICQRTEEEYQDTIVTRLKPNGWVILIQTRWSENDLAGRILPEDYDGRSGPVLCRDGQTWYILNIPAKAEHDDDPLGRAKGEYLWPEWFPVEHWLKFENNPRGRRTWNSLCQQRPKGEDGIDFQREWFHWYDPDIPPGLPGGPPGLLTYYGASDFASREPKQGERLDYTEHGLVGLDNRFDFWFMDWWFGQKDSDVYISAWIAMLRRWPGILRWWHEGGPIGNAITPAMVQAMRQSGGVGGLGRVWVKLESMPSIRNKTVKLASFQARAAARTVHLPLRRPWATRIVDQLLAFPAGRNDDAADVCGLLGRGIDSMIAAHVPSSTPRKELVPFTEAWWESGADPEPKVRYT